MDKRIEQITQSYKQIFDSENGKKVLQDLANRCSYNNTTFVEGDSHATAFEEGKRSVFLFIKQLTDKD